MKKATLFLLLGFVIALLIVYNNQLVFYFQAQRLTNHAGKLAQVYSNDQSKNKPSFCSLQPYSKVWAHRVNSLPRFVFLLDHFQGFEVDIVFDENSNFFDVRHPPATSINLSFEKYLQTDTGGKKMFWLDVKNLTNGNENLILSLLLKLDSNYNIRQRVIIESNNITALSRISGAGFFTSYYYDWDSYKAFIGVPNSNAEDVFNKIDAVSQDVLMFDTLRARFPLKPKLTWALSIRNYFADSLFNSLDRDRDVLVYLVNIKSPGYR